MKPYFGNKAKAEAIAAGLDEAAVADAVTLAYPHFLHVMAILFVLNVIIMLIIGKVKPRSEAYEQVYTKEVDITPWKLVKPVGALICVIVIFVYIYFS